MTEAPCTHGGADIAEAAHAGGASLGTWQYSAMLASCSIAWAWICRVPAALLGELFERLLLRFRYAVHPQWGWWVVPCGVGDLAHWDDGGVWEWVRVCLHTIERTSAACARVSRSVCEWAIVRHIIRRSRQVRSVPGWSLIC